MAAAPRLTPEEWAKVREVWECDPRDSFEWIVRELSLPVVGAAVRKKSKIKGHEWSKRATSAENAPKPAPKAPRESTRDQKGRGSVVGKPEGGEQSPPKGFRKGIVPKRKKPAGQGPVIDMATGKLESENQGSQGSANEGSQGSVNHGFQGSVRQKWSMNLGSDEHLWRDQTPMVPPKDPEAKGGRPTQYQKIFAHQAFTFCLRGATNDELAELFQVSVRTIQRWLIDHKEFCHAVLAGKAKADAEVAKALYKRAIGYTVPEVHISNYKGEITITETEKHYPPDVGAATLWLINRVPEKWSTSPELPAPDPGSNTPFTEELDKQYQLSMEASAKRAAEAREDRRRFGKFGKRPELDNPEEELPFGDDD